MEIPMKRQVISELALLDRVQMSPADRAAAKAMAIRAEAIAEAIYRATQFVQSAVQAIGRSAQRLRARFA
jgi:hypothetical protein